MTQGTRGRKSIEIPGVKHKSPLPMASRVGKVLYSSAIPGLIPFKDEVPEDPTQEIAQVFANMDALLDAAQSSRDDIIRATFFISEERFRSMINPLWVEYFPDPENRPSRHILVYPSLQGKLNFQMEIVAEYE